MYQLHYSHPALECRETRGVFRDGFQWEPVIWRETNTCEELQMTGLVACSIAYVTDVVYPNIWATHQNT